MSAEVVAAEPAGGEMDALCPGLLLPTSGEAGTGGSQGASNDCVAGTSPLTVGQSLLLTDASMAGDGAHAEAAEVEIFVEAVAGNVSLSSPGNTTGMATLRGQHYTRIKDPPRGASPCHATRPCVREAKASSLVPSVWKSRQDAPASLVGQVVWMCLPVTTPTTTRCECHPGQAMCSDQTGPLQPCTAPWVACPLSATC